MEDFKSELLSLEERGKKRKGIFSSLVGWILLIAGLVIIGWTLIFSYNILTLKIEAPEIFKIETKETLTSTKQTIPISQIQIQEELEKMISEQLKEVLPLDFLPKTFNLFAWSIFAFILIFGGSQISGLGIKLIKK